MAIITVQIGQCGNQLGHALFAQLAATLSEPQHRAQRGRFFYESEAGSSGSGGSSGTKPGWTARAVLVDTESKAIAEVTAARPPKGSGPVWRYDARYAVSLRLGAGNCWAAGRHRLSKLLLPRVLAALKAQIKRCAKVEAILLIHSAAGGTGSGVGSYLTEKLAHALEEDTPLVNVVVLPHRSGEVAVQNLNVCLALSTLAKHSSAIIAFANDTVQDVCEKRRAAGGGGGGGLVALAEAGRALEVGDLNEEICRQLCGLVLPSRFVVDLATGRTSVAPADIRLGDILALFRTSEAAGRKLLTIYRRVTQLRAAQLENKEALAEQIVLLSERPQSLGEREMAAMVAAAHSLPAIVKGAMGTFGMELSVTSYLSAVKPLRNQLLKCTHQAALLLQSGAYVHHYEKNGVTEQALLDAVIATIHLLK